MRPADFSVEQIIEAGQALQSAGRSITGFALRQKVGGGNPGRLKQVWDEYVSSQTVAQAEPVAELPVEVSEQLGRVTEALVGQLSAMALEINDRAVKASERRVHEVVRAAGEQREQAERELADASQTVDDLEQQLDSANQEKESLTGQLAQVQSEKQSLAVELAQVRERLVAVEKAAQVAASSAAAQEKALRGELDQQRRAEQMAREREAQATGALHAMEKQHLEDAEICQNLRGELRTCGDALAQAQATGAATAAQIERLQGEMSAAQTDLKSAQSELKVATKAALEASAREQVAVAQLAALKNAAPRADKPAKAPRGSRQPKAGDKSQQE